MNQTFYFAFSQCFKMWKLFILFKLKTICPFFPQKKIYDEGFLDFAHISFSFSFLVYLGIILWKILSVNIFLPNVWIIWKKTYTLTQILFFTFDGEIDVICLLGKIFCFLKLNNTIFASFFPIIPLWTIMLKTSVIMNE